MRRAVWLFIASILSVGVLLLFVFPTRTLLQQDREIAAVHHQIAVLQAEDASLRARAASLTRPSTVERIARQQYGLVKPGQKEYVILPAAAPAAHPSPTGRHHDAHHSWWELWRDL